MLVSTLLPFLHPLLTLLEPILSLFGPMHEEAIGDEPEPGTDQPDAQHTDQPADEPAPGEPKGDEPDDEPDDPELVRGNAARKIGEQGSEMRAGDLALISLLAEAPSKAPRIIAMLQEDNPKQAARIAKMFNKNDGDLAERLKDADPVIRETLQGLADQVSKLSNQSENDRRAQEGRIFKSWRTQRAPELDPKSAEGKLPVGKKLREQFQSALDTLFPSDSPLTEDMLEDALAVAKRRSGWQAPKVKAALDKQAVDMAARARAAGAPGGSPAAADAPPATNPRINSMFGRKPGDEQKIAAAKKAGGFQ
jgi:hypothetical protein